jgi:HAD superfamily phosphoserine phosphatase-like hydrolase
MIVLFDLDSTLTTVEWSDRIAKQKGKEGEVKKIAQETQEGKRSFDEAFPLKTNLVAPSKSDLKELVKHYLKNITPKLPGLIKSLSMAGITCGIVTQWYAKAAKAIAKELKMDFAHGVEVVHDEEWKYKGLLPDQPLLSSDGKKRIVEQIKKAYPGEEVVFIGDKISDINVKEVADRFIGSGINKADTSVLKQADTFVHTVGELKKMLLG